MDEGGIPTNAKIKEKKYTPGKPYPNSIEFFMAVGNDNWACKLVWPNDKDEKYTISKKKLDQMKIFIDYFKNLYSNNLQPFIFYIDARWSSIELQDYIQQQGFKYVMSCSTKMKPQKVMTTIRQGLNIGEWHIVGLKRRKANLLTVRTKKKVYLNLLSNWASMRRVLVKRLRRKFPAREYTTTAPAIQKEYNQHKCKVDQWNKSLLSYWRLGRFVDEDISYTQFFLHGITVQAYTLYKANTNSDITHLDFRKQLLMALSTTEIVQFNSQGLARLSICWPESKSPQIHKCQIPPCRNNCTLYCARCNLWGCSTCLLEYHKNKR